MDKIPKQYVSQYEGLIKNRVISVHKKHKGDYRDLLQEGFLCLCNSYHKFDPSKDISFSTYLYTNLNFHFKTYINKNKSYYYNKTDFSDFTNKENFTTTTELKDSISKLSSEAKEVISIIFNAPAELMELTPQNSEIWKRKITKKLLIKYLKNKNWPHKQILESFAEIKEMIKKT